MKKFVSINGLNHSRYVGIAINGNLGKVYDFDYINRHGYRPAESSEELKECERVAKEYYDSCVDKVKIGDFSISYLKTEEL